MKAFRLRGARVEALMPPASQPDAGGIGGCLRWWSEATPSATTDAPSGNNPLRGTIPSGLPPVQG
jgi:hypothetical protein